MSEAMYRDMKLFAGRANEPLAASIAERLGCELGKLEITNFSDGEIWAKYDESIRGSDVYIIQPTLPPSDSLFELLVLIDAAKRASAARVTAVIPYFGYARQDRKDQPRVAITAKLVANLITTAGTDRVLTMDLHAAQIQGFFDIPFDHLYASPVLLSHFREMGIENLAVCSPDLGGIKVARAYAKRLGADLVVIDKRRPKANVAEVMSIIGEVQGKNILLVDDLIDTGGTFVGAVDALKKAGALDVYGAVTHPILSGQAVERVEGSAIKHLVVTDTVQLRATSSKIQVVSVAEVFAEAIRRTTMEESISGLFEYH